MNQPCDARAACPLFPVAPSTTVYHGGRAGDVKAGFAWAVFSDAQGRHEAELARRRRRHAPHRDALYDPGRGPPATDLGLAARRLGQPRRRSARRSGSTTSTPCSRAGSALSIRTSRRTSPGCAARAARTRTATRAAALADRAIAEATFAGAANCDDRAGRTTRAPGSPGSPASPSAPSSSRTRTASEEQKVSIDVRAFADYTSLAALLQPAHRHDGQAPRDRALPRHGRPRSASTSAPRASSRCTRPARSPTQTAHFLTGESLGRGGVADAGRRHHRRDGERRPEPELRLALRRARPALPASARRACSRCPIAGVLQF